MNSVHTLKENSAIDFAAYPSVDEMESYLREGRRLRAEAVSAGLSQTFAALNRFVQPVLSPLAARVSAWHEERVTLNALSHCTDRVLADIGINREEIPFIAKAAANPNPTPGVLRRLVQPVLSWNEERRTRIALSRCNDRVLADIGVRREEIPLIAKGMAIPSPVAPAEGWRGLIDRIAAKREERIKQRRTYNELMSYTDRELHEVGIHRGDIAKIAKGRVSEAA